MKTVVDSKAETTLKKLQAEGESGAHDEATAIEVGKITTAEYGLFTKIRKTDSGYTVSADYTDLTTGEQVASVISKEYSKSDYLYASTGAADELTLALAGKLGITLSDLTKNLLISGSAGFSVDEQLALAKQNEAQFQKMMNDYNAELAKLMNSTDVNAIQDRNRIEAEKALLVEKQNAEKKRQAELLEQKQRAAEDAKLEAERSIALITQRDQLAKEAAAKASEVRQMTLEKQGVLSQIGVIEAKKKALVGIRESVELRCRELYSQMLMDINDAESRIRTKEYSTVELGSDGKPTEQAKLRRENQIVKSKEDLQNKFFEDCTAVKESVADQDNALLTEIQADYNSLSGNRSVSSLGDELKVSIGKYEGSQNGWEAYISLYSEGVLLYTDTFILSYEAVSGKKAPDMETELDDAVIDEYASNVDMYSSLFTRGDPVLYYEILYSVVPEADDKPSQYLFNFNAIKVFSTITGQQIQINFLSATQEKSMTPTWDLREKEGIAAKFNRATSWKYDILEIIRFSEEMDRPYDYMVTRYLEKGLSLYASEKIMQQDVAFENKCNELGINLVEIPKLNIMMLSTEVTQELYTSIIGENPSYFKGNNLPVETVSIWDAMYFCNKLSVICGLTPVYSFGNTTDVEKWQYTPHKQSTPKISTALPQENTEANGFRLPNAHEYSIVITGSEDGWYKENSGGTTHPVTSKPANSFGLFDLDGNVSEMIYSRRDSSSMGTIGGNYKSSRRSGPSFYESKGISYVGFRIVCTIEH